MIQLHWSYTQPTIHVLPPVGADHDWATASAAMLADAIARTIANQGRCRLAVSPCKQALPVYAALRQLLPNHLYSQLWLTWTDDQVLAVANDVQPGQWQAFDPNSGVYRVFDQWLAHVPVVIEQVLPLVLHGDGPRDTVRFGQELHRRWQGGVDVVVLTVGRDGQMASLWPGHPAMDVEDIALLVHDAPRGAPQRVVLGPRVLGASQHCIVLASGAERGSHVLDGMGANQDLPLVRVRSHRHAFWLLDRAAARQLIDAAMAG